jgi:hypothetical protein
MNNIETLSVAQASGGSVCHHQTSLTIELQEEIVMLLVLLNTMSEMKRIILHYCLPGDVLLLHDIFAPNSDEKDPCFLL